MENIRRKRKNCCFALIEFPVQFRKEFHHVFLLTVFEKNRGRPDYRLRIVRSGRRSSDPAGFQRLLALYTAGSVCRPVSAGNNTPDTMSERGDNSTFFRSARIKFRTGNTADYAFQIHTYRHPFMRSVPNCRGTFCGGLVRKYGYLLLPNCVSCSFL